jgi:hypothetical protein
MILSYREEATLDRVVKASAETLGTSKALSQDAFNQILTSPGLFRLFLTFSLERNPEFIIFVREMMDVSYKIRAFDDKDRLPDAFRKMYSAVFHRYFKKGAKLEVPNIFKI